MAENANVPLVVDLDGTVIRADMMWESLALLLRRNPLAIFQILVWWSRGRARLKQELAKRVQPAPATLPYHQPFLEWLRREKAAGRKIILATASDRAMAEPVASHLGVFDEILASDGKTNLRRENKRAALVKRFGERGFDYAGNSKDDLMVWRSAQKAVVVNASPAVLREAGTMTQLGAAFCGDYVPREEIRRFFVELFWRSGYLTAVCAGLLLAAAFPKWSIAGFAWVAPAILLAAAHGKTGGDRFRVGYFGGLTFWLVSLYWLLYMPVTGFPILGWFALGAFVALYFAVWVWMVGSAGSFLNNWSGRALWAIGGAAAWVALEMVRAWLLGGFPWSFLGVSQYQLVPLIQIAAFTGVYGVSFLVAWFSLSLYSAGVRLLKSPGNRYAWQAEIVLPMAVVTGCYIFGFIGLQRSVPAEDSLRVTAIQPSAPQTLIWNAEEDNRRFQELLALSQKALDADRTNATELLVWPESAVPGLDVPTFEAVNQFALSNHVWLVLNDDDVAAGQNATNFFNAAYLVGPDGKWRQVYHKRKLVIFGEYVPLADWLPFLKWLTPISGGWTPGGKAVTFQLEHETPAQKDGLIEISSSPEAARGSSIHCAPLICFEDTFPGATRDSSQDDTDFLVNLTNDGWFGESAEQRQHMANAVFRAVENGRPLLRCANNGVTCLIDDRGRLTSLFRDAQGSEYGPGFFTVDIPLLSPAQKSAATFYNRHGDWFGWGCLGLAMLLFARKIAARRRA